MKIDRESLETAWASAFFGWIIGACFTLAAAFARLQEDRPIIALLGLLLACACLLLAVSAIRHICDLQGGGADD